MTMFDGKTFDPSLDEKRLGKQLGRVFSVVKTGGWFTLSEISKVTGDPEASISSRLRDLRKEKFGSYIIHHRRRGKPEDGLWEYKIEFQIKQPRFEFDSSGQGVFA